MAIIYADSNTDKEIGGVSGQYVPFKANIQLSGRMTKLKAKHKLSFVDSDVVVMVKEYVGAKILRLTPILKPQQTQITGTFQEASDTPGGEPTLKKGKRYQTQRFRKSSGNTFTLKFSKEQTINGVNSKGEKKTKKALTLNISVPKFVRVYEFLDWIIGLNVPDLVAVITPSGVKHVIASTKS